MNLMSEILALRSEIEAHARKVPSDDRSEDEPPAGNVTEPHDVETLLKLVNETVDEFAGELDRFPRLTALVALGVGLAAGVVISRRFR
ncbi:hypothetical protein ACQKP1_24245 [Allorhizobium sp. NPDC080224]|uniref:DUF883 domain-containing protein n=2 Tax=Alphaproteobacteria TaxID=28211 RepID=A0A512HKD1_9HYPH|nr:MULTISPECIES: hypothetical protein [Alphaproteobacteria]NTE55336.1 hypothetical protein [Agrobacterium tumefaciens]NTE72760.1 hypothetical protein [Agrobacterium tumefaciens]GEO85905.1 hypothetical protein RNA01_28370 [Ciceribacter naphthalenivorans]GLR23527.1 hypothetical protein GCM10007920_33180 [Ciceribacter naphthalenivorans]GLT06383.1 hypothetical protein GCM10007926_33180 [Sphingomonas psychrolutea]